MSHETPSTEELQARIPTLAEKCQAYRDRKAAERAEKDYQPGLSL